VLPRGERTAKMPKKGAPLAESEIALLRDWIAQGALDDTPAGAATPFSVESPPTYAQLPVVTSLDFAPGGGLLAAPGYHEVLLWDVAADGRAARLAGRLIGMSERIQAVAFSPDGAKLAAVGGSPGRFGEVQLWDVAEQKLERSLLLGGDTLYGGGWSPDGKLLAFGGGDTSVRALDTASGELVFFNAASEDLALDVAFSKDGSHLVSAGRDRALKLFQVATQQFLDNITSITPGALKGGLQAVDRQPGEDVLLIGGADGQPKTYKMHRTQKRVIGDDFNHLKSYAPLPGRLFACEYAPDGARFVAGASHHRRGEVRLYAVADEAPKWTLPLDGAIYAATFRGDGAQIAAAGFAGEIALIEAASGQLLHRFAAAPLAVASTPSARTEGRP
jgi:WD40 repeat protein